MGSGRGPFLSLREDLSGRRAIGWRRDGGRGLARRRCPCRVLLQLGDQGLAPASGGSRCRSRRMATTERTTLTSSAAIKRTSIAWMARSVAVGCSACAAHSAVASSINGSDTMARTSVAGKRRVVRGMACVCLCGGVRGLLGIATFTLRRRPQAAGVRAAHITAALQASHARLARPSFESVSGCWSACRLPRFLVHATLAVGRCAWPATES